MTEQEKVPAIRFAGFTDPWEQRKLGEIVSIGAGAPPSAFSAGNFLYVKVDDLNESSHFQFDSAQRVDANTAVKPIRKGSIIFAKRGAAILGNKVRVLGKTAYIDTNMMALEPRGVDADFLWLFINQTGLYRIADTSTIPQINNKHIEPYPVDIPNMAEQQAIGTFFSRLDDLITLHQRKYDKLQIIKKAMLEKMFPQNGSCFPEIRFKGFTDSWEQRKLGELGEIMTGSTPSTSKSEYYSEDGIPWVTPTDINSQTISDTPRKLSGEGIKVGRVVPANTILCTCIASIGKNTLLTVKGSFNQQINCLTPNEYNDAYFLLTESEIWSNIMKRMAAAGTMQIVNKTEFSELTTMVPKLEEQKKIGQYFHTIGHLITLHQREVEKLQNIKKSMLETMFV